MKNIVIIGSNGLLGQSMVRKFNDTYDIMCCSVERENYNPELADEKYFTLDITNRTDVKSFFRKIEPDVIINTAAFTDVDGCEDKVELCWEVNSRSLENIIEASKEFSPLLVQISTDYIFDGRDAPYRENDTPNPEGFYGRSKLAAERIVGYSSLEYIIARTQILYGTGHRVKKNFALWVIDKLQNKQKIRVVNDQIGNPTFVDDLSEAVYRLIGVEEFGIFHVSGKEECNRYEFAISIAELFDLDKSLIKETTTSQLTQKAPRPMNSKFILDKLFNRIDWLPLDIKNGLKELKKQLKMM
jgi:dTDP-4-dehydrorhamnose reductase